MVSNTVSKSLDLSGVLCPINFVKVKLAMEELQNGELLEVILDDGEPMANVPKSIKEEGHKIIKVEKQGEQYRLTVEKRG